ncbi:hypothetical protein ACFYY2_12120 [Streptomyces sp. NPDC001822]|uniref:hypothetical protein n=1 Tax=Streptomyces sp. NPDC001822 TaxID=3364614 RepID=UPI0036C468FC
MSWRYVVKKCKAETHGEKCGPWTIVESMLDAGWKDMYRLAATLPHAIVSRTYVGTQNWSTSPYKAFEHIEGGGLCYFCGKGRGPLCKTGDGNHFLCEPCQKISRRDHKQWARDNGTTPSPFTYVPIIETLDHTH